jgi:hypothetical protein
VTDEIFGMLGDDELAEQTVMLPLVEKKDGEGDVMLRIDLDGKPVMVVKQYSFNAVQFLFGAPSMVLSGFDTWRVFDALMSALRTLPLDLNRPAPSQDEGGDDAPPSVP